MNMINTNHKSTHEHDVTMNPHIHRHMERLLHQTETMAHHTWHEHKTTTKTKPQTTNLLRVKKRRGNTTRGHFIMVPNQKIPQNLRNNQRWTRMMSLWKAHHTLHGHTQNHVSSFHQQKERKRKRPRKIFDVFSHNDSITHSNKKFSNNKQHTTINGNDATLKTHKWRNIT